MNALPDWNTQPELWLLEQNEFAIELLNNPLLQKDVWQTTEDLGLTLAQHNKILSISFERIEQDWLKLLAKLYILLRVKSNYSAVYLKNDVASLVLFSHFIASKSIYNSEDINEQLFSEFDYHLHSVKNKQTKKPLSERTISLHYMTLINFFNLCRQEGWLDVNTHWFKGRYVNSTPKNDNVEYIPEEVWNQLDKHLHLLPSPIQRMVLIIRATGLRIGELLNLPLDCLRKRGNQWRLRFLTEKYKTVDELPICEELVRVVQEQQNYIRQHFGNSYDNLFGSNAAGKSYYEPVPRIMSTSAFNGCLNRFAIEKNICTKEGKQWHFRSHQFRKTVATVMTNAGVRDLIIQKYLRHRSPDMQNYYKHLLKEVVGEEYFELMQGTKYVDSTGKIVKKHKPNNPITELMRRKMYQITTQYGECHRPVLKTPCQTVNACWQCEYWLTSTDDLSYLKQDLQTVEEELEIAHNLGLVRQEKGLSNYQKNLRVRIKALEQNK